MANEQNAQKKLVLYQMLNNKAEVLAKRREMLLGKLIELQSTLNSVQEIDKKTEDMYMPIGSSVYLNASVKNADKMIVGIGADIALEKDLKETKDMLDDRTKIIQDGIGTLEEEMLKIGKQMAGLEPEIRRGFTKKS